MSKPLAEAEVTTRLAELHGWKADGNRSLTRELKFANHIEAIGFVVRVAMAAEVLDHHPDLRIVYNKVDLVLSTHDAGGVTAKDFELASRIDKFAGQ